MDLIKGHITPKKVAVGGLRHLCQPSITHRVFQWSTFTESPVGSRKGKFTSLENFINRCEFSISNGNGTYSHKHFLTSFCQTIIKPTEFRVGACLRVSMQLTGKKNYNSPSARTTKLKHFLPTQVSIKRKLSKFHPLSGVSCRRSCAWVTANPAQNRDSFPDK